MDLEAQSERVAREIVPSPSEMDPDRIVFAGHSASPLVDSLRRFARDKRAIASVAVIGLFIVGALIFLPIYEHIGPTICERHCFLQVGPTYYHSPTQVDPFSQDQGPSGLHWLGTNGEGIDILARLLAGVQTSMIVAVVVVGLLDVGLGILFGVLAGYFGGIIDTLLARFTDLVFAFPGLLFAFMVTGIFGIAVDERFGSTGRLLLVSFTLGLVVWPQMARYVRGQTLQLKEQQFIEAARTVGTSPLKIISRHIIPNIASLIIVAASLDIAGAVINEGVLSLLGLGVQPPGASLGVMINENIGSISLHPWETLLPAVALAILVLAFSFIGDGMRDAFDPRTKD